MKIFKYIPTVFRYFYVNLVKNGEDFEDKMKVRKPVVYCKLFKNLQLNFENHIIGNL